MKDKIIEKLEECSNLSFMQSIKHGEIGSPKEDFWNEVNKTINDLVEEIEKEG